jgi:hypothetical protein
MKRASEVTALRGRRALTGAQLPEPVTILLSHLY